MLQQYQELKAKLSADCLLFFQLGDFFELFYEDATEASRLLGLTLTSRQGVPMCGLPCQNALHYIGRLVQQGKRVAICEQAEPARPGQLVRRMITRVWSPGSYWEEEGSSVVENRFCAALWGEGDLWGLAYADLGTGEFFVTQERGEETKGILFSLRPREVLLSHGAKAEVLAEWLGEKEENIFPCEPPSHYVESARTLLVFRSPERFDQNLAQERLAGRWGREILESFRLRNATAALRAAGALLEYLEEELHQKLPSLARPRWLCCPDWMVLDTAAQRTLELWESSSGDRRFTLVAAIDRTVTPGGGRLLRRWLAHPLRNRKAIEKRHETIAGFLSHPERREELRKVLATLGDPQRQLTRILHGMASARDLLALKESLRSFGPVREYLQGFSVARISELRETILPQAELVELLEQTLDPESASRGSSEGVIREGRDAELDRFRKTVQEGKNWMAKFLREEQEKTAIRSLKIGYSEVLGYYLEVTKPNLSLVPPYYERKQTLAHVERYTTRELRQVEWEILEAQQKAREREKSILEELCQAILQRGEAIHKTAEALAELDVLLGWAVLATERKYVRPEFVEEPCIEIEQGRHPVLEQVLGMARFVPNDTFLNRQRRFILLTGPNMAGKSTYLRQVALICLLAQIGCFVPAGRARLGLLDRIFTRVGASDELARGRSTFFVEMSEVSQILAEATQRSLVLLDEVGRGTDTYDGLAIAWAVAEHLYDRIGCLTLFATHYHELVALSHERPGIETWQMSVEEGPEGIRFLHTVRPGESDRSYGIFVAKLAGLPAAVLARAQALLEQWQRGSQRIRKKMAPPGRRLVTKNHQEDLELFSHPGRGGMFA